MARSGVVGFGVVRWDGVWYNRLGYGMVLLANPPETTQQGFTNPPLGLLYLAGSLEHEGFEVKIVDGCIDGWRGVQKALTELQPDVVGIPQMTPARWRAMDVAYMTKRLTKAKVVFGGPHPTIMHQQLKQFDYIDDICLGDGEAWICNYLDQGNRKQPGIDDLPFPAWGMLDLFRYPSHGPVPGPRISVEFSRGCPAHCNFCSSWWIKGKPRVRNPSLMVEEMRLIYDKGIRSFCFVDDTMTTDKEKTIALCELLAETLPGIGFSVTTRADVVDRDILKALKAAGCYEVLYGIESGSNCILDGMHKGADADANEKAIRYATEVGLRTIALVITGNIGETDETVEETRQLLKRAKPVGIGCAGGVWILPGTAIYQHCKRHGFIDDSFWLGDEPFKVYTLEASLEKIAEWTERVHAYNRWVWFRYVAGKFLRRYRVYVWLRHKARTVFGPGWTERVKVFEWLRWIKHKVRE